MVCSLISELAAQNTARGNVQGNLKRNINVLFFIFTHVLLFTRKAGQGTKIQRVKFGEIINYLSQAAVWFIKSVKCVQLTLLLLSGLVMLKVQCMGMDELLTYSCVSLSLLFSMSRS